MTTLPRACDDCRRCEPGRGTSIFTGDSWERDGGRWTCHFHASEDERALVRTLDERARARGLHEVRGNRWPFDIDWPYGATDTASRERLLTWLETNDLVPASGPRHWCFCLRWARLGYCRRWRGCDEISGAHWIDHPSYWKSRDGHRWCLVVQPYQNLDTAIKIRTQYEGTPGISHIECREDSWYGFGTVFIGIWGGKNA